MSLRARLALGAAAAVATAVILASVLVYFIVRQDLYGPINSSLEGTSGQVSARFGPGIKLGPPGGSAPGNYLLNGVGLPLFVPFRLVTTNGSSYTPAYPVRVNGRPTTTGGPLADLPVSLHEREVAAGTRHSYFFDAKLSDVTSGSIPARIYVTPLGPQPGYAVEVAQSIREANHTMSKIEFWLILIAIGGIGLAGIAGFLVARAALRPVRSLSETAERVRTTRDLTQRIHISGNDELSHLAATFNAMLESLDEASRQQRQLVQDASHELRTPLTSLRTNIELLASNGAIPEQERAHMLSDIVEQLGEMTAIVGELTELARGEAQRQVFEEVRLDLIAEDAVRRTERNHPDVQIDSNLERTTVVGVPASLERAFANLLDNAAKWSPEGRHVEVTLQNGELVVRDHGPGISPEDLPHVFDRFYRATSARSMPGSGLGLAIVKQVAESHGGSIAAERAPDGGTIMRLRLGASVTSSTPDLLRSS